MNLLFDFITLRVKTGAGEYVRRVFFELMDRINQSSQGVNVFALYDSTTPVAYEDMTPDKVGISFLDIKGKTIAQLVNENKIDKFFIGCSQYIGEYPLLEQIKCEVICVTHDLCYEEFYYNRITPLFYLNMKDAEKPADLTWKERVKMLLFPKTHYDKFVKWYLTIGGIEGTGKGLFRMKNIMKLYHSNPNFRFIVVSDYTKTSAMYYLGIPEDRIHVLYSPERFFADTDKIDNEELAEIIKLEKRYFLMVSCHSKGKNPTKVLHVFETYCKNHPEVLIITIGYKERLFANHIDLPFLSDNDLTNAYKYCYAMLYPSFFEGFGYPPLEAMHFGKPVLCSNVTSMPGIYEDASIYFSPMYESSIFAALTLLTDSTYSYYSQKSKEQYAQVRNRQEKDLETLIRLLLN